MGAGRGKVSLSDMKKGVLHCIFVIELTLRAVPKEKEDREASVLLL